MTPELPILPFASQSKWADWLAKQHDKSAGVWLKLAKKDSGIPTVTYAEALEVALCYGWIDGQKNSFDEKYFLQKFTPRRPKSIWSKINVEKVERLIASGQMKPAGLKPSKPPKRTDAGNKPTLHRRIFPCQRISSPRWTRLRKPKPSLRHSTVQTDIHFYSELKPPRKRRHRETNSAVCGNAGGRTRSFISSKRIN